MAASQGNLNCVILLVNYGANKESRDDVISLSVL